MVLHVTCTRAHTTCIIVTNSILAITPVSMGYGPGLGKPLENLLIFYANFQGGVGGGGGNPMHVSPPFK